MVEKARDIWQTGIGPNTAKVEGATRVIGMLKERLEKNRDMEQKEKEVSELDKPVDGKGNCPENVAEEATDAPRAAENMEVLDEKKNAPDIDGVAKLVEEVAI